MSATIYYRDIGDYLSREQKLDIVKNCGSITNVDWQVLIPNKDGDWINMRNDEFRAFIPLEAEKKFDSKTQSFFVTYSNGVLTAKDSWLFNFSNDHLQKNVQKMVNFYNEQRIIYHDAKNKNKNISPSSFLIFDTKKISWTDLFIRDLEKNINYLFDKQTIINALYRPFIKNFLFNDKKLIQRTYQLPSLFPTKSYDNLLICITGLASTKKFTVLLTNKIPCYDLVDKTQCFPLCYVTVKYATP